MPKGTNQKLKLYYLSRIMVEKTDDEHVLTMPEIQRYLEGYGVTADRKSLYDDLEALRVLGIDVIGEKDGRNYVYHVGKKQFEKISERVNIPVSLRRWVPDKQIINEKTRETMESELSHALEGNESFCREIVSEIEETLRMYVLQMAKRTEIAIH